MSRPPKLTALQGGKADTNRAPFPAEGTTREQAAWYIDRGIVPIPIPLGCKAPELEGFTKRTLDGSRTTLDKDFAEQPSNIGALLGEPSGGLTDADLDVIEAIKIADRFLPQTRATFGRPGAPRSHRLYRCVGAKNTQFPPPIKTNPGEKDMLVELRSTGWQTVVPGSIHQKTGELIAWDDDDPVPTEIEKTDLDRRMRHLAVATLLGRHWPTHGTRNVAQLALAGALVANGLTDDEAVRILCAVCWLQNSTNEDERKRRSAVELSRAKLDDNEPITGWTTVAEALGEHGETVVRAARKWLSDTDNVVILSPANIRGNLDDAERALAREGGKDPAKRIYARGDKIVRLVGDILELMPEAAVFEAVAANAKWKKRNVKDELVSAYPPLAQIIRPLCVRSKWRHLSDVRLFARCPMLRPDGSVIQTRGFDAASGVLYVPDGDYPAVPEQPTEADVAQAIEIIEDVIGEFPFVTPEHRSAAYAAILTPAARALFHGPCPLFLYEAPTAGTGKDFLAKTSIISATGQEPHTTQFAIDKHGEPDEAEIRKDLVARAIEGARVIYYDNVVGRFGGAALCHATTETKLSGRVLGKTVTWSGDLLATFYASGSNPKIGADMHRRICPIRIDRGIEKPSQWVPSRHRDLIPYALSQRTKLVWATLTILRYYWLHAKDTDDASTWGTFAGWARVVIGAVKLAGLPDPGKLREAFAERADTDKRHERSLVHGVAWLIASQLHPSSRPDREANKPLTSAEIVDILTTRPTSPNLNLSERLEELGELEALHEAIQALVSRRGVDFDDLKPRERARRLGNLLADVEGRVYDAVDNDEQVYRVRIKRNGEAPHSRVLLWDFDVL